MRQITLLVIPDMLIKITFLGEIETIGSCIKSSFMSFGASLIAQLVKNPPAIQETLVRFLCQEYLLEKG